MTTLLIRNVKDEFVLAFKSLAKGVGASYEAYIAETKTKVVASAMPKAKKTKKAVAKKVKDIEAETPKKRGRKPKKTANTTATKAKAKVGRKPRTPKISAPAIEPQNIAVDENANI